MRLQCVCGFHSPEIVPLVFCVLKHADCTSQVLKAESLKKEMTEIEDKLQKSKSSMCAIQITYFPRSPTCGFGLGEMSFR